MGIAGASAEAQGFVGQRWAIRCTEERERAWVLSTRAKDGPDGSPWGRRERKRIGAAIEE